MSTAVRRSVFVSYAHEDRPRLTPFEGHLEALTHRGASIWIDREIQAGDDWLQRIERQMHEASCALLMVSRGFLASEFIREKELPRLLDLHDQGRLRIFWVALEPCAWELTRLQALQAAVDPRRPLWTLPTEEQDQASVAVCKAVADHMGQLGTRHPGEVDEIVDRMRTALGGQERLTFGELIGGGRSSVVCSGTRAGRDVVLKILLDHRLARWTPEFQAAVARARGLHHDCFITLLDDFFTGVPHPMLVLERLDARPLSETLQREGRLGVDRVRAMLIEAAGALDLVHQQVGAHGVLTANNVFVNDRTGALLLSPVSVSSFLSRVQPWQEFLAEPNAATYLLPEQYDGTPLTPLADQYSLALLALEMLHGVPPVQVTKPADFELKRRFFEDPLACIPADATWPDEHPLLKRILSRMLRRVPQERYPSLKAAARDLARVEPDANAIARRSYVTRVTSAEGFFTDFYARFFERCPDAAPLFSDVSRQADKLRGTAVALLDFDPDREPNALTAHQAAHRRPDITPAHFEGFLAAFLDTLEARGATARDLQAWRTVFQPALQYLAPER